MNESLQSAIGASNDLDRVAFAHAGLIQVISGEPYGQAVAPAADRLLEVPALIIETVLLAWAVSWNSPDQLRHCHFTSVQLGAITAAGGAGSTP